MDGDLLAVVSVKWAKCAKSASSLERGRAQRGAFSSRASRLARPRESTGDVGPYLALRSALVDGSLLAVVSIKWAKLRKVRHL